MSTVTADRAEAPIVLALDLGSSSARAIVYDGRGREVEGTEGRSPCHWIVTPDGGVEGDPNDFLDRAFRAVDAAVAAAGGLASQITAVGISTFWHNIMGVDSNGRPATPLYSWADERSAGAAQTLRDRLDERAVRRRTGCVFHPSYPAARLLWLRTARPEAWGATRTWMSIGEYLALRCLGRATCSVSMASGTGMFDQTRCEWDAEVLEAVGVGPDRLSPVVDLGSPVAGLLPEFAARWPVLAQRPWLPAAGDGALNNLGTGCVDPARAALTLGTSGALRVMSREAPSEPPQGLWHYRLDRARLLTGGAVSNGGNVFRWVLDQFALGSEREIEQALRSRRPDGHGLTVLPFLAGERSPGWPLRARGAVVGLTLTTEPLDLLQAALEAVALRMALIWDRLRAASPQTAEIIASGGALLHLPAWLQIMADVLGHEIIASAEPEGSSRGAALVALELAGAGPADRASAPLGARYHPDPERHGRYRDARARHLRVEAALDPLQA